MPSLRENKQPDAVIDLRHGSLHRTRTDESTADAAVTDPVVLVDDGLPELPPAPVFTHDPVLLDAPGSGRKRRRVGELETLVTTNARAAQEARAVALEQREYLEAATKAWRATAADQAELRRELKHFASARADLIAKERSRAEQTARTDVAAELQRIEAALVETKAEADRLRVMLADQQSVNADSTRRLRDALRARTTAEKEAKRANAAYETAERGLDAASEALHRTAVAERERLDVVEAERAAAVAELAAFGGDGQVSKLTQRVEDLVSQLAEIDAELIAMESRAEAAETAVAVATERLAAAETEAEQAGNDVARARKRLESVGRERDTLRVKIASLEEVGEQSLDRATASEARAATAEAALNAAATTRDELTAELSRRDALLERRDAELGEAVDRLDVANTAVADLQVALATARSEIEDSTLRSGVAEQQLDDVATERDALLLDVAGLEQAAEERERRAAADLTRVALSSAETQTTELEKALGAARSDADALRAETNTLSAQLEEAWKQVEAARVLAEAARTARVAEPTPDDPEPPEIEAPAQKPDRPKPDRPMPARKNPSSKKPNRVNPDRGDPDARRAALGYLNSLAKDLPATRRLGR